MYLLQVHTFDNYVINVNVDIKGLVGLDFGLIKLTNERTLKDK